MNDIAEILAVNLRRLRKLAGWDQSELAERAKISFGALQRYEQKRRWPEKIYLDALIKALNCGPSDLFMDPETTPTDALMAEIDDLMAVLAAYRTATRSAREDCLGILQDHGHTSHTDSGAKPKVDK